MIYSVQEGESHDVTFVTATLLSFVVTSSHDNTLSPGNPLNMDIEAVLKFNSCSKCTSLLKTP